MIWIYILETTGGYYVGETCRLYRRFREHMNCRGGENTRVEQFVSIVGIYPASRLRKFFIYSDKVRKNDYNLGYNIYFHRGGVLENFNEKEDEDDFYYDSKWVENNIAEKMMLNDIENWKQIRGGKYVRFDTSYTFPVNNVVEELPICKCGFPCDVKQNEDYGYLYFRCSKKNMWDGLRDEFDIYEDPCDFFMKYTRDNTYRQEYEKRQESIITLLDDSYWLKKIAGGMYQYCVGGCGKEYDENNTIRYSGKAINLCFDCFIDKNEELEKKYTVRKRLLMGYK